MVTLNYLEKERIRKIKELEPKEIDIYLEKLILNDIEAFERFDLNKRDYYSEKISELIELHQNTNIHEVVNYKYFEKTSDLLAFYKVKHFVFTLQNILFSFNISYNSFIVHETVFYRLIRQIYNLYKETESDFVKTFEYNIKFQYNLVSRFFKESEKLFELLVQYESVEVILESELALCNKNFFLKDSDIQKDLPKLIEDFETFFSKKDEYERKISYFKQVTTDENLFDDLSEEAFYDCLFEKYPFLLELEEDSDEYKEKVKDIPSGLLEPFILKEPMLKLTDDDFEIVFPSGVSDLSDEMKKRIKEVEDEGYILF